MGPATVAALVLGAALTIAGALLVSDFRGIAQAMSRLQRSDPLAEDYVDWYQRTNPVVYRFLGVFLGQIGILIVCAALLGFVNGSIAHVIQVCSSIDLIGFFFSAVACIITISRLPSR